MDPKSIDRIYCDAAAIATPSERAAYLDRACGEYLELRQRVEQLLEARSQAAEFLEQPAAIATLDEPEITERPGAVIGPYKILEQIGEGGFGIVFMAEQSQPVRRKVALKILKPGMDTRQVVARFEAERQALAIMDHPNIARVFDGGATPSGRPFFVMELVKGVPITEFCDQNHLAPRQRLELFVQVCQAVQHAHQKGIIHRDLKPFNILAVMHDTIVVPKIIDFGIAKALGQELTDRTLFTGFAQMVGTPLYMSPEQAGHSGLDVDTRSDIYSLGVLLYELLTGTTPFSRERFQQAAHDEIRRIIREEEPPKPSTRLSELGSGHAPYAEVRGSQRQAKHADGSPIVPTTLASIAAQRHTEPAKLTKLVRGELDWIVMKSLEKDRNRRYETANGFAMDIQRYLANEPVAAGPPSARYRLTKFLRRHRGPMLTASLVFLALVSGIIGTTWQAMQAERARAAEAQRAEGERLAKERAEANFELANAAVEKYLGAVTKDPDLNRADFHQLRKKLLESALPFFEKLAAQKSDDPEVEAGRGRAYHRVAVVRTWLGENEAAVGDMEAAQAIFSRLAAEFPTLPEYRYELSKNLTHLGQILDHLGKRGDAEAAFRQARSIWENLAAELHSMPPEYHGEFAVCHNQLGNVLKGQRKFKEAEDAYRRALDIRAKVVADFPSEPEYRMRLAQSHNNLGMLLADLGKAEQAEKTFRQGIAIQEELVAEFPTDPDHRWELARSHHNLGILLSHVRKHRESEAVHRRALAVKEKLVAEFPTLPEFRMGLAASHECVGIELVRQGKHSDAAAALRQAVEIYEKLVAAFPAVLEYRRQLATSHNSLGGVLVEWGKQAEARAEYRQSLDVMEKLAADFPHDARFEVEFAGLYCNFGHLVRDSGQPEESLHWFQKALARLEPVLAKEPRLVGARQFLRNSHWGRAEAFDALGRYSDATREWERTLELDDGHDHPLFRSKLAESRLRSFQKGQDAAGCLTAAAEYEALQRRNAGALYNAACFRAICAAVLLVDPKTPAPDAERLAQQQADRAMDWLHKAVAAGYLDAEHMKQDKDLDALRERADFQKLLAELEAKTK